MRMSVALLCVSVIPVALPVTLSAQSQQQEGFGSNLGGAVVGVVPPRSLGSNVSASAPVPLNFDQLQCLAKKVEEAMRRSQNLGNQAVMFDGMVFCGQRN